MRRAAVWLLLGLLVPASSALAQSSCINPSPSELGWIDGIGDVQDVVVSGSIAYVVTINPSRIEAIDVSNPASPFHIGTITTHGSCGYITDAEIVGGLLYSVDSTCAFADPRLEIVNVSDPENPFVVGSLGGLGSAIYDVEVSGNYAYLLHASSTHGNLFVIDVSDPTAPAQIANLQFAGSFRDLEISGSYAYATGSRFTVVDISNPSSPSYVTTMLSIGNAGLVDAEILGPTAYVVADLDTGIVAIDISDPTAPVEGSAHPIGAAYLAVTPGRAYVTLPPPGGSGPSDIAVVDVANASAAVTLAQSGTDIPQLPDIEVDSELIYIAARDDGLRIFDLQCDITEVIDSTGDGTDPLSGAQGIAVDAAGNVYVGGSGSSNVFRIPPGGPPLQIIDSTGDGTNSLITPHGLAADAAGNVYVTGINTDNVFKVPPVGPPIQIIDSTGDGTNPLTIALGVAVDETGNVYVAGQNSANVFKIPPVGPPIQIIDSTGDGTSALDTAFGVAVDLAGNVYVTGHDSDNVFVIPRGGPPIEIIDSTGDGTNGLDAPTQVAVDAAGNVYVAGFNSDNVFKIPPGGSPVQIIDSTGDGMSGLDGATGVAVDAAGNVYVTGQLSDNAFRIMPGGTIKQIIDAAGDGSGKVLTTAYGIAVDSPEIVYVGGGGSSNVFRIGSVPFIPEEPPLPPLNPPSSQNEGQSEGGQLTDSPAPTANGLVLITHGRLPAGETSDWIDEMKSEIVARLVEQGTADEWTVDAYHWTQAATHNFPATPARKAEEEGQRLGEFYAAQGIYTRYHLIGHSAGSWLIEAMAERLESTGVTIHTTFLDSYVDWQHSPKQLGDSSTWSEQYVDGFVLPDPTQPFAFDRTDFRLSKVYNLILTGLSTSTNWSERHAFPWQWYLQTVKNPNAPSSEGWGFARSQEMGNLPTHGTSVYTRGDEEKLGPLAMRVVNYVHTSVNMGEFAFDLAAGIAEWVQNPSGAFLRILTQSPAWVVSNVAAPEEFNAIQFEYEFVSNAEGWLSVHFAGQEVLARDERYAPDAPDPQTIVLTQTYPPGSYPLSFRVDPYTAVNSEVHISNLRFALFIDASTLIDFTGPGLTPGFGPDPYFTGTPKGTLNLTDEFQSTGLLISQDGGGVNFVTDETFLGYSANAPSGSLLAIETTTGPETTMSFAFKDPSGSGLPAFADGSTVSVFVTDNDPIPDPRVVVTSFDKNGSVLEVLTLSTDSATLIFSIGEIARLEFLDNGGDGFAIGAVAFGELTVVPPPVPAISPVGLTVMILSISIVAAWSTYRRRKAS